jgi:hypothetical protein
MTNPEPGTFENKICPNSRIWHLLYLNLLEFTESNKCSPPEPPAPLILNSWMASSDTEKSTRWQETMDWCQINGCSYLLEGLGNADFYCSKTPLRQG